MVIHTISQAFKKAPNWNGYENLALCRPKKLYINHGDLISPEASETRILWIFIVTGAVLALGSIHLSFWNFFYLFKPNLSSFLKLLFWIKIVPNSWYVLSVLRVKSTVFYGLIKRLEDRIRLMSLSKQKWKYKIINTKKS